GQGLTLRRRHGHLVRCHGDRHGIEQADADHHRPQPDLGERACRLSLDATDTMSRHVAFRRQPVDQQFAQALRATTLPAPTRGINQMENEAFMQPGSCIVSDNWVPTLRGVKLRGGCTRWCVLPETTPIISAFEYQSGNIQKMFAANATKVYDVTTSTPVLVKSGQASGNYVGSQLANASGDYLLALNDAGDYPLRFNGTSWVTLTATMTVWANSTAYALNATAYDASDN